ncbi:MAG TPA: glucoamylase, partial [Arthrobacter bacterium]|nr:glucoamylase [Arthrobacter sp.]
DEVADIVRIVEGVSGSVRMHGELALRFDYGHIVPWVRRDKHGVHAVAGPDSVYFVTDAPVHGESMRSVSDFTVQAGERVSFVLTWAPSHVPRPHSVHAETVLDTTLAYWRGWAAQCTVQGKYQDAVFRSLITLKALTYAPTGGIVAAVTTSLPEQLGGPRNWDYRYC